MNGRHSGCREVIVICIRLIEFFKLGPKETEGRLDLAGMEFGFEVLLVVKLYL